MGSGFENGVHDHEQEPTMSKATLLNTVHSGPLKTSKGLGTPTWTMGGWETHYSSWARAPLGNEGPFPMKILHQKNSRCILALFSITTLL